MPTGLNMKKTQFAARSNIKYLGTGLFALIIFILLLWFIRGEQRFFKQVIVSPTPSPEKTSFRLEIPQKALWRNYVTISAEAAPGTTCDLIFVTPTGQTMQMDSLADATGTCTWRWKVEESYGKGNGRLIFTIDGKSETHFIEIRSSF